MSRMNTANIPHRALPMLAVRTLISPGVYHQIEEAAPEQNATIWTIFMVNCTRNGVLA